jgi:NAD(P)-dependent dehydrogenase (short-subunit alcohol dehydrogenase family)
MRPRLRIVVDIKSASIRSFITIHHLPPPNFFNNITTNTNDTNNTNNDNMATVQKKTALITGCSTGGIGWAMAKIFHDRGFYVFATARDPSNAADLSKLSDVEILELDVTIPETISRCKETVAKRTGGRLDVLVNNAGVEFLSPLLDVDVAEAKRLYDVNVWGPLLMVQAFSPLLIEAKGVISNQSSIDGALSMVWAGKFNKKNIPNSPPLRKVGQGLTRRTRHFRQFQNSRSARIGNLTARAGAAGRTRRNGHVRICRYAHVRQARRSFEASRDFILLQRPGRGVQGANGSPE